MRLLKNTDADFYKFGIPYPYYVWYDSISIIEAKLKSDAEGTYDIVNFDLTVIIFYV
jgi:hypothetical protein